MKKCYESGEVQKTLSSRALERYARPGEREKQSQALKKYYDSPESKKTREQLRLAAKKQFSSLGRRKKHGLAIKAGMDRRKQQQVKGG